MVERDHEYPGVGGFVGRSLRARRGLRGGSRRRIRSEREKREEGRDQDHREADHVRRVGPLANKDRCRDTDYRNQERTDGGGACRELPDEVEPQQVGKAVPKKIP